jgi:hypothetical protein
MESIRFDDDEPTPHGQLPSEAPGPEAGNRPAEGARYATPGQVLRDDGTRPVDAPEDFLDLESEAPELVQVRLEGSGQGEDQGTPAWLLQGLEAGPGLGGAETVAEPGEGLESFDQVGDEFDEYEEEYEEEYDLDGDPVLDPDRGEFGDEVYEEESYEGDPENEEVFGEERVSGGGGSRLLRAAVMVLVAGGLGAGGYWYGRPYLEPYLPAWAGGGTEIASAPRGTGGTGTTPNPAPLGAGTGESPAPSPGGETIPDGGGSSTAAVDPAVDPAIDPAVDPAVEPGQDALVGDPGPVQPTPVVDGGTGEGPGGVTTQPGVEVADLRPMPGGAPTALAASHPMGGVVMGVAAAMAGLERTGAAPTHLDPGLAAVLPGPGGVQTGPNPDLVGPQGSETAGGPTPSGGTWRVGDGGSQLVPTGSENVSVVWQAAEVPMQALEQPVAWLTPGVGTVRVRIDTNDLFEGRLYSMGAGEVVLDTKLGRIRLDGERVRSVERIVAAGEVGPEASDEILPGERVRAKTPGGWLVGRVVSNEGGKVTLLTETGGRITLDNPEIQPLARESKVVGID